MTATERYIDILTQLKSGDLGLLRAHSGQGLDNSVDGFDLFAGLWWPLRERSERAPRREVAWMIAKLYAFRPLLHQPDATLAPQLSRCRAHEGQERKRERFRQKFDEMLSLPLDRIEASLGWALRKIASYDGKVDWVRLTDDLSIWERETTRARWAEQFIDTSERT